MVLLESASRVILCSSSSAQVNPHLCTGIYAVVLSLPVCHVLSIRPLSSCLLGHDSVLDEHAQDHGLPALLRYHHGVEEGEYLPTSSHLAALLDCLLPPYWMLSLEDFLCTILSSITAALPSAWRPSSRWRTSLSWWSLAVGSCLSS